MCHVERSETSLFVSLRESAKIDLRFFASLRMTYEKVTAHNLLKELQRLRRCIDDLAQRLA